MHYLENKKFKNLSNTNKRVIMGKRAEKTGPRQRHFGHVKKPILRLEIPDRDHCHSKGK